MTPAAVLVGPPGAGKSTVGRLLAERLGVAFTDTDDLVVARAGKSVADVFVDDGEAAFRALEAAAVAEALDAAGPAAAAGVLALGGGAVLDPGTRERLAGRTVVFLEVDLPDAAARVGLNRDRPLLLGNPRGRLKLLMDERRPLYEEVASLTVPTSGRTPDEVVDAVLAGLGESS